MTITRELNAEEEVIMKKVASWLPTIERDNLLADIALANVIISESDQYHRIFELRGYQRPGYKGQKPYSVEGSVLDEDGESVSVLLYKDHKERLLELELIRWDGGDIRCLNVSSMHPIVYLGSVERIK